jgi:hypothetical protein
LTKNNIIFIEDSFSNRENNLVELGIGDKEDVIEYLINKSINYLSNESINFKNLKQLLKLIYNNIDEEQLREFLEKGIFSSPKNN